MVMPFVEFLWHQLVAWAYSFLSLVAKWPNLPDIMQKELNGRAKRGEILTFLRNNGMAISWVATLRLLAGVSSAIMFRPATLRRILYSYALCTVRKPQVTKEGLGLGIETVLEEDPLLCLESHLIQEKMALHYELLASRYVLSHFPFLFWRMN
jgi:hypothetical protein